MPGKAALVMELVSIKSPEKAPVRQQLLVGMNVTTQSLNNKIKKYIHVPKCIDDASADTALRKYKVDEQIVERVGSGAQSPEELYIGALWMGKYLTKTHWSEFATCLSRAGITVMAPMSLEATAAMWHDALVTKTEQRKIVRHLFDWFGHPITAKETDVDTLAGKTCIKCQYGNYSFLSRLGKEESDDNMKKRRRDITVRY
jgi:hypothetical protein